MMHQKYVYIFIMFFVSFLIRVLPLTLIRKEIRNRTIRSFLYYVPYVTLAVMTFPAIMDATAQPMAGLASLVLGMIIAWFGGGLFPTAIACSATVFVLEMML